MKAGPYRPVRPLTALKGDFVSEAPLMRNGITNRASGAACSVQAVRAIAGFDPHGLVTGGPPDDGVPRRWGVGDAPG